MKAIRVLERLLYETFKGLGFSSERAQIRWVVTIPHTILKAE